MNSVNKKAAKAGLWYTICTFILKGLVFISMPVFTRILSVSDIGLYSNFVSWITILGSVTTLDLYTSVNLAHFEYDKDIYKYMSSILIFGSIATLFFYSIAFVFSNAIMNVLGINKYMLHIMFAYFLVYPAISILHAKFRIYLQYKYTIITSLIPGLLSVIMSLLFTVFTSENKLNARVNGYYGIWILFAAVIYVYIIYRGREFQFQYIKFALPISIPLIIHVLANTILSSSDRVMIQKICGSEYTAFYSIAYNCALLVSILWSAVNQAWAPWCFEMMHQKNEQSIREIAKPILLLFSTGVLLLALIAPEILFLMGGRSYLHAVYVVPPVMLGYIAQMLYTLYVNIESYYKKQKQIMIGTVIAAIINVVLNICFIPVFGYVAAAYTTLAGYIVLLFIHFHFVKNMGLESIYDMRFNVMLLSVMTAFGITISFLYKFTALRLTLIFAVLFFVVNFFIKNKDDIINIVKKRDVIAMLKVFHLMGRS